MRDETSSKSMTARAARLQAVIEDVAARRWNGELLPDAAILAAHADLRPELDEALHDLRRVEEARAQADQTTTAAESSSALGDHSSRTGPQLADDSLPGYRLLHEIHRGGQGVVYLALQKSTKRQVAVKIIKQRPFAGPHDRLRFEREVQILGQLDHPHIVTLHDSGEAAGQFFFVMDYVAGQPLDVYMAGGTRSIGNTLKLFVKICDAVNAAHLRGVIHRDLKPSNIRIDEQGEPHVLDFGLAKLMPDELADDASPAAMTVTGQFVGTPAWASPEQAEQKPAQIDLRTDVYSLGVILYQMLTGQFPYDVGGPLRAVLERIQTAMPRKPRALRKQIDDEVETIVLKCLQKERARRYQSAGELARDVGHYLAGEPIEAKRDSALYVLRKTLRRYRLSVAVVGLFVFVLLAATVGLWSLYREQIYERRRAEEQRTLAEQRAKETQQVAGFQSQMLRGINIEAMGQGFKEHFRKQVRAGLQRESIGEWPDRRKHTPEEVDSELKRFDKIIAAAQPVDVARQVMDEFVLRRAAEALEKQFARQPVVQAQLHSAIGVAYEALGLYGAAAQHHRSALELRRQWSKEPAELIETLNDLGLALNEKGDYAEAEEVLREALNRCRKLPGPPQAILATATSNLAVVLDHTANLAEAEALCRESLALKRTLYGAEHLEVATTLNNLGTLLVSKGEFAAAQPVLSEVLQLRRKLLGPVHLDVAESLSNLGVLFSTIGKHAQAQQCFEETLAIKRQLLGDEHPAMARTLDHLAILLFSQGEYAAAEPLCREGLSLRRRLLGDEQAEVAKGLQNLAVCLKNQEKYAEAERAYRESLAIKRKVYGPQHPSTAGTIDSLAVLLEAVGNDAAEPLYREALAIRQTTLGEEHPDTAVSLQNLACFLRNRGEFAAAEPYYRQALAIFRKSFGNEHRLVAQTLNGLSILLKTKGDYEAAEPLLREALAIQRKIFGGENREVGISLNNLARLLMAKGDYVAAESTWREALNILERRLPPEHSIVLAAKVYFAQTLTKLLCPTEAEELLRAVHEILQAQPNPPNHVMRSLFEVRIDLYTAWEVAEPGAGHAEQAAAWRKRLEEWQTSTQPAPQPASP